MSIKIAISNHKGGVGKTTSTLNIGAGLALRKQKVLLIDLDAQANLTQCCGLENPEKTIYGAFRGEYPLTPYQVKDNLHVVASCLDLAGIELEIGAKIGRERMLTKLLIPLVDEYDYILFDCPPSLGLITVNAFCAADKVYIPLQAQFLALHGLDKLMEIMKMVKDEMLNPSIDVAGVFVTQYDKRKILNRDISDSISGFFKEKVFSTIIRDNVALAEAPASSQDIFTYSPDSPGAKDYKDLVSEILKRNKTN
jgi:chromosome partitioning protein